MAATVISSLLLKIGATIASEVVNSARSQLVTQISAFKELVDDISDIKDELEHILSFLQITERLTEKDENTTKTIIKQTRDLAFNIEDIIDEFTYKIGEEQGGILSNTIGRIRNIGSWNDLSKRLRKIKVSLRNIQERRVRYNIGALEIKPSTSVATGRSNSPAEYAHFFKEDDLVGIDENKDLLLRWLKDEQQQHMIISVWGMGGLGKTTLVTHAYNIIKTTFEACAWVPVSQSYKTREDLLRKILKEYYREDREKREVPNNIDTMDYRSLVENIRTYLQCKKYVLILDDVWRPDVLDDIKNALLSGNSKSRIVLTTRIRDVALLANEHRMLELKTLEADDSWDLFCKYAFWKSANKICPPPLEQCAKKIVEKCGGLPLAIVSIGRLLSFREQTDSEWEKVYKDLEWYLTNNESKLHEKVYDILKLSLDDLPHYLQNCFLYCSSFPEDYEIESDRLISLWVAEGFIEERERTMEEVAEDYLNELVHRCLLQVVESNEVGRVYACRMHDIIRVLALSESNELSFCMNYEQSKQYKARRLSILSSITEYCTEDKSHLRSVLVFNHSTSYDLLKSVLRSSKLLRVLELRGAPIEKVPSEICNLFNLRYLGLRRTKIKELPRSIGKLQNLQTLDIFATDIEKLPKGIINLQNLRHLFMLGSTTLRAIEAPVGIWCLKGLQTLNCIKATTEFVQNVEALTELRTFRIEDVRTHHCADLWNGITKMSHLKNLSIESEDEQEVLQQLGTLRLPIPIQTFNLEGELDKTSLPELATSFGSLSNLTKLTLSDAKLDEDTFPYLQTLPALMILDLDTAYAGMKLHFQATSFPKPKELSIAGAPNLRQIEIERGALPSLTKLYLFTCPELKDLPNDIEYLTTLQDLFILCPAKELIELLLGEGEGDQRNEYRTRVRHIPNFTIRFRRDSEFVTRMIQ